jgi:chaperone modulatory protein CbpM
MAAVEVIWLDARQTISLSELIELSGLDEAYLRELVENGVFTPVDTQSWRFSAECLSIARTAHRLQSDLDLDTHGLALVLTLVERIRELELELKAIRK